MPQLVDRASLTLTWLLSLYAEAAVQFLSLLQHFNDLHGPAILCHDHMVC